MAEWLIAMGLGGLKPLLGQLLMPPLPLLLLAGWGAWRLSRQRRASGWLALGTALLGLWLVTTPGFGRLLLDRLAPSPPPLSAAARQALRGAPHTAILVLGAGRRRLALETGQPGLKDLTLARLHHGIWLARQTGLPIGYTGGVGFGAAPGDSEAAAVGPIAAKDFGLPMRWLEDRARDTRENARFSLPLLKADGITRIVLVTHGFHQRRALANFEREAQRAGIAMQLVPAPMGLSPPMTWEWGDWLPAESGFADTRIALHEWLGWLAGA